jgi:F0F1-type ATP synthase membrane subunit c/vacuolar-type H+-ATPase subunit K
MEKLARKLVLFVFFYAAFFIGPKIIDAQVTSSGIAIPLPVNETVEDGDMICTTSEGSVRCKEEYDPGMFGVYSFNPSAQIIDDELNNSVSVVTQGVVKVKVTNSNGNIQEGDLVTSSKIAGAAMKATRNGYVLGVALENFTSQDRNSSGKITVAVNIHPDASMRGGRNNLIQFMREGATVPLFEPLESLRYLLSVLIILMSFVLGLVYFGRASRAGIEAIGRNPLAKRAIQMSIVLHVVLSVSIIIVGLVISYLILIL